MALTRRFPAPWRRPLSVYTDEGEPVRHASWLELFFDLVFVVVVAELGANLHHHLAPVELLHFAALFAIVWWLWLDVSYFADVYDTEDVASRLTMVAIMFGAIFLSQTVDVALHGGSFAFAAAVLFMRVPYTVAHLRARYVVTRDETRPFLTYWVGLQVLVTVVWALSLLVPAPGRYGLWIASFLISTAGITVIYLVFEDIEAQVSHFSERLGLFTILVLGETILAVAIGTSVTEWRVATFVVGGTGFLVAVAAWWLYFERFDERVIDWAIRTGGDRWLEVRQQGILHIYGHYLVHAGIVAAGVGVAVATESSIAGHSVPAAGRLALGVGVASFLLGSTVCHVMAPASIGRPVVLARTALAGLMLAVALVGGSLAPLVLIASVALGLVAEIAFETWLESNEMNP